MLLIVVFFKQKTAYEVRISDWSSDVFSSDLRDRSDPSRHGGLAAATAGRAAGGGGRRDPDPAPLVQQPSPVRAAPTALPAQPAAAHPVAATALPQAEIGRASCRERVCPYVSISLVAV